MLFSYPQYFFLQLMFLYPMIGYVYSVQDIGGLHYYETLDYVNRESRVRRSLYGGVDRQDHLQFNAFNRSFEVFLKPGTDTLANGFAAKVIHADGRAERFHVDVNQLFTGHLADDPEVAVNGHMEDTMIALTVFDYEDVYTLEPARIYRTKHWSPKDDRRWIVYRYSDTSMMGGRGMGLDPPDSRDGRFCASDAGTVPTDHKDFKRQNTSDGRNKRGLNRLSCHMLVVSTYDYFVHRCQRSHFICGNVLINAVSFGDQLFHSTNLGKFSGFRVRIKEMVIYNSPTPIRQGHDHFNSDHQTWNSQHLLEMFSQSVQKMPHSFCFAFLFNAHLVKSSVLGLAYIGSSCSIRNTGFASSQTSRNNYMTSLRNKILFVHVVNHCLRVRVFLMHSAMDIDQIASLVDKFTGHIFGSIHDPDTKDCFSPSNKGGRYIMWPYISDGRCPNCQTFSPCSRKFMENYLEETDSTCFTDFTHSQSFCGNGLVEEGEECDEGFKSTTPESCCNYKCRLVYGAVCSDQNKACCKHCQMAPAGVLCRSFVKERCVGASYCSGESLDCPTAPFLETDTPCQKHGKCYNGTCQDFCRVIGREQYKNFEACQCESDTISGCKLCCYDATDPNHPGTCKPYSDVILDDHRPCYLGQCKDGVCQMVVQKSASVFKMLSGFELSEGSKFMRGNIVTTVVVLSLMVWIPVCFIISTFDDRSLKKYQDDDRSLKKYQDNTADFFSTESQNTAEFFSTESQNTAEFFSTESQNTAELFSTESQSPAPSVRSDVVITFMTEDTKTNLEEEKEEEDVQQHSEQETDISFV